jgi:hypothetical protein
MSSSNLFCMRLFLPSQPDTCNLCFLFVFHSTCLHIVDLAILSPSVIFYIFLSIGEACILCFPSFLLQGFMFYLITIPTFSCFYTLSQSVIFLCRHPWCYSIVPLYFLKDFLVFQIYLWLLHKVLTSGIFNFSDFA